MLRRLLPLALLAVAAPLCAQQPEIKPDMLASTEQLHTWLHSGDPRLIAWAATFARTKHNPIIVAEMPAMLEHWSFPETEVRDKPQAAQRRAVEAMLDALIEEDVNVPMSSIRAIDKHFDAQALILISRKPLSESKSTLDDWHYGPAAGYSLTMQRVAAMMLAKDPQGTHGYASDEPADILPPFTGLVGEVVAKAQQSLLITVTSEPKSEGVLILGSACGDSVGGGVPAGWPEVFTYSLSENDSQNDKLLLIDLNGDHIDAFRHGADSGWGSCFGVQDLNSYTRHHLIAYWLGVPENDMAWQPNAAVNIVWKDKASYDRQLGEIVENAQQSMQQTSRQLQQRGFLTADEAEHITPRLTVRIKCEIKPCPLSPAP